MLTTHTLKDGRLAALPPAPQPSPDSLWLDLLNPTREEEQQVERLIGIEVPTREEMAEIEVSSRLYRENDTLYMTANLLVGGDGPNPATCPVTFILTKGRLVTVRYAEPSVFRVFAQQAARSDANLKDADAIFIGLLEAVVDRTADILEKVAAEMDAVSREVFQSDVAGETMSRDYKHELRRIGRNGDLNSKLRDSLVSLGRIVNYVSAECGDIHPGLRERTAIMADDIRSLADHASYVAGTTAFLLQSVLGLINIEQSNIIKIVSVVAVLIMPPTLVASVYGMNFQFMPELGWRFGYPLALAAMVVAGVLPYLYFKRRRWL
jgi:magnesium transporter